MHIERIMGKNIDGKVKTKKTFEEWFKEVDKAIRKIVYVGALDLPDCCYHDWYTQKVSPSVAAKRAIKNMYN